MDIGCNINDAALLRNLAEDVPDMAASIRHRLRELADLIEALEASARPEVPALHEGMREVPCAVRDDGWLYIPHASGQWVTAAKLQPFSLAIIQHWKAEQSTRGVLASAPASYTHEPAQDALLAKFAAAGFKYDGFGGWQADLTTTELLALGDALGVKEGGRG